MLPRYIFGGLLMKPDSLRCRNDETGIHLQDIKDIRLFFQ